MVWIWIMEEFHPIPVTINLKQGKPPPPSETLPDMDNEQPLALVKEQADRMFNRIV
jgi:hypothetical protein